VPLATEILDSFLNMNNPTSVLGTCQHEWVDTTVFGQVGRSYVCAKCASTWAYNGGFDATAPTTFEVSGSLYQPNNIEWVDLPSAGWQFVTNENMQPLFPGGQATFLEPSLMPQEKVSFREIMDEWREFQEWKREREEAKKVRPPEPDPWPDRRIAL
jgi:hypothetical protein